MFYFCKCLNGINAFRKLKNAEKKGKSLRNRYWGEQRGLLTPVITILVINCDYDYIAELFCCRYISEIIVWWLSIIVNPV